jgi:metallo-beta-lactamase family protein
MLIKNGYRGPIYCTAATADVTAIILRDSAHLQQEDYTRFLKHIHGKPTDKDVNRQPLYSEQDVERTLPRMTSVGYELEQKIAEGITIKLSDAGHILGAASVRMTVNDGNRAVVIVFSGDVGQTNAPILRDPVTPTPADVVLLESTYGDQDHRSMEETRAELLAILQLAEKTQGKIVIPAFAVGRTQDLVFHIGEFIRGRQLKQLPVYIDSPMATSVSDLYSRYLELYDERATELIKQQMTPLSFPGVIYTHSVDESKQLNDARGSMVIISANGMCTGGRILHHLRHNLPDANAHIVIVGYQGQGTLGRRLVDGAKFVSIMGGDVPVRAKVHTLGGFSAHAGQTGLVNWVEPFKASKPKMFLTHGEDGPRMALHDKLLATYGLDSAMPYYGNEVEL